MGLIENNLLRLDEHIPTPRHGLPGIHKKVHEDLLHLRPVHLDDAGVFRVLPVNGDFLLGPAEHGGGLLNDIVHGDGFHIVAAAPGKPQQLPCQIRSAGNVFLDMMQSFIVGMGRVETEHHQGGMPLNPHEQIVEVMGDTPGQRPDRFQLLRPGEMGLELLPLLLRTFALGDVGQNVCPVSYSSLFVTNHKVVLLSGHAAAINSLKFEFAVPIPHALQRRQDFLLKFLCHRW